MGIHRNARYAIGIGQYDVGGFTADSRQRDQLLHSPGHLSVKPVNQIADQPVEVFGFALIQADGANPFFNFFLGQVQPVLRPRQHFIQRRHDFVDLNICGLS
ncbi:hypothetical protein SDC9_139003 [bioreactor metagenome]|uniref:Uncharacterized protein n=1 Tax=bioreactor metagenome TaxID=1076179 RepID=A0A645DRI3_9ZZZZ